MLPLAEFDLLLPLGVVPVFVNAGAALLPAILGALASIVSLLFRPRDLWQAARARPRTSLGILIGSASLILIAAGLWHGNAGEARRPPVRDAESGSWAQGSSLGRVDWAASARQWLQDERVAALAAPADASATDAAPAETALILGGGPLRNGYAGGGSPLGLTGMWEFPRPGTPAAEDLGPAMFLGSPTVRGDAVFVGSCLVDVVGNFGTLFCLDAATGQPRWSTSTYRTAAGDETQFKGFFSTPALSADGRYLVVGQGLHFDEHCELLCVLAKTGQVHWRLPTPLHIEGSPAIEGDLAVAGAGAIERGPDHEVQGHPGLVVAVKISTGEKLWEYQVNDPESSPVIDRGMAYIGSGIHGNAVYALRTESSAELAAQGLERLAWRTPTPLPATGDVTLSDELALVGVGNSDYVFTASDPAGAVLALDRITGQIRWQLALPDSVLGRIAVVGNRAIVPVRNGEVLALDLSPSAGDKRVVWRQRISGERAILAGPAFTGTHVYAVSQDGSLAVLDAQDGRILERVSLNAPGRPGDQGLSVSSPTIAGGRLYVGSETGGLRCFAGRLAK